jgi:spore coat-associated protein N
VLRLLAFAAALGALAGAGGGTLAASLHRASGVPRVKIALGIPGRASSLRVPGITLAAGDTMQRPFDLRAANAAPITRVAITSRALRSSLLDRDRLHGLRVKLDRCSTRWRKVRTTRRYVCRGRRTIVLRLRPVIGYGVPLRGLRNLPRTRTAHLLMTLRLPATAPNALQNRRTSLAYTFTAVQAPRPAASR